MIMMMVNLQKTCFYPLRQKQFRFRLISAKFNKQLSLSSFVLINHSIRGCCGGQVSSREFKDNFGNGVERVIKKDPLDYKVIFLGSDEFSLPSLKALTNYLKEGNLSVVVSNENNLIGKFAKKQKNQPVYSWQDFKNKDWTTKCNQFDFGVVASFGYLIPAHVINRFPLGILNVHGSILPRWRGASPVNYAIIHGDAETGVSIMKIAPHRFDIGPVLYTSSIALTGHEKASDLRKTLAEIGASALMKVIGDLSFYLSNPVKQNESYATTAPKITPELAEVDWSSKTSLEVYRLYRGLYGFYKLNTDFYGKKVDLDDFELISSSCDKLPPEGKPGEIVFVKEKNVIYVRCKDSTWISVGKVKLGTKWMTAKDFQNGFLSKLKLKHKNNRIANENSKNDLSQLPCQGPFDRNELPCFSYSVNLGENNQNLVNKKDESKRSKL